MRPVTDPDFDVKAIVAAGYDRCASDYAASRRRLPPPFLNRFTEKLPDNSKVIDIGCGCGQPISAFLARRYQVTGVDVSAEQIKLAKEAIPDANFIHGDVTKLRFGDHAFDAAVMMYALFHIPRDDQFAFLLKLRSWLADGGFFLVSLAQDSEPGYLEDDFFGTTMYWSHFSKDESLRLLARAGFELIWEGMAGHGYDDEDAQIEHHPIVLLQTC